MKEILERLNKMLLCLYKLNKQFEDIEYRLIMVEEAVKDGNESLEAIKHSMLKNSSK